MIRTREASNSDHACTFAIALGDQGGEVRETPLRIRGWSRLHRVDGKQPPHPFSKLDGCTHGRPNTGFAEPAYLIPAGRLRVIVDACGPPGAQDQAADVVPLSGEIFVHRQGDLCACLGGNRQNSDSLVGFVAPKNRTVDTHEQTDFVNDGVKDLVRRNASSKQSRNASKRGLLGLDLREMRISSGAISDIRRHFVTTLTIDSTCPSRSPGPASGNVP